MNKELTKEEAEEYYNKLWLENRELIQENIDRIYKINCALERLLIDKDDEIERLKNIIKQIYEIFEKGTFEDNCDCIQIEAIIAEEIKGSDKE